MSRASEAREAIRQRAKKLISSAGERVHEFKGYWFAKMPEGEAALRIEFCIKPTIELARQLVELEDGDVEAMEHKALETVIDHLCLYSHDRAALASLLIRSVAYRLPGEFRDGGR